GSRSSGTDTPVGAGVPDDAAGAGSGVDSQLGAWAEDVPLRHGIMHPIAYRSTFRSVRQAGRRLTQDGDRRPYPQPGEQLVGIAAAEHPFGALVRGIAPVLG